VWEINEEQRKVDAEAAGQKFVPEEKVWEEIACAPTHFTLKKFVICIDSIGQDREFTQAQKEFALNAVYRFRKHWEDFENTKLLADRDALMVEKKEDLEKFSEEKIAEVRAKEEQ
jgi:hypothetical protein